MSHPKHKDKSTASLLPKSIRKGLGVLCGLGLLIGALNVHAAQLFRYKDANGVTVLSYTIPNDRVPFGYDVVDEFGALLKRIPPQLSETAYREKLAREAAQQECRKTLERVKKLYQTEADIEYALNKGLESIDQSISNIRANLQVATTQRKDLEAEAAQLDISGRKISNSLLDNIERAKVQERNFQEEIEKRFADKLRLRQTNEFDRAVFAMTNCDDGLPSKP